MSHFRHRLNVEAAADAIKSPTEYNYMKIVRVALSAVGAWPLRETGYLLKIKLIFKYFYMVYCFSVSTGAIIFIIVHNSSVSFFEAGHMYLTTMIGLVDLSRHLTLTMSKKYDELGKDLLTKYHLFYFKHKSDYAMKTHKQVHLVSHLFTLMLTIQMLSAATFFNVIPIYNNYASGKYKMGVYLENTTYYEHSVYISFPFDSRTYLYGYIAACSLNCFLSYVCATWLCMFDLFLSLMVFHTWGHLKILIHNLHTIPIPTQASELILEDGTVITSKKYSRAELKEVNNQLNDCIDYHRDIMAFTNRMSDVFGPMLLVYHMFDLASGCLLLLECSQMTTEALMRYVPLTIVLFQALIQLSVVFELLGSESDKLKEAVYSVTWEDMDPKTRKVVLFFLMNVQEPIRVKAMGLASVGVTTMAFIIKTSLSYFTFLRSM